MDLFTHVLVAYLLTFGIVGFQPQYLAAGALAGGLPDADALFFPIARRFPVLRHHGITHSIFGVSVVAVAGAFLAPLLAPGSPFVYFVVMEVGGISHMLEDGFTHFSVPPLLPFSNKRLELDADRAINLVTLVVSVTMLYVLLGVERFRVPYAWYLFTLWGLSAFYAAYFGIRLSARLYIGRSIRKRGLFSTPIPTANPFVWLVLSEVRSGGRVQTRFARYTFGRGITKGPFAVDVPLQAETRAEGPIRDEREALARSYPLARKESRLFEDTYHFGEAESVGGDGWVATWYSLEYSAFGRAAAVRVRMPTSGAPRVEHAWYRPRWGLEPDYALPE